MKKIFLWFNAVRPLSLVASIAPVVIGIVVAYGDGFVHWPSAWAALAFAVFIQLGTNLSNDYYDFLSGVDSPGQGRPDSVLVSKGLSLFEVKYGFIFAFFMAVLAACFLIMRIGMPALVILAVSIVAGFWYTAGKWSLARLGLGDVFVLFFFGPVASAGTYWVLSYEYNAAVALAGLMPGFLSTGVLVINNLRDIVSDSRAGRLTWAVRFGKSFVRMEYLSCVLLSAGIPIIFCYVTGCREVIMLLALFVFLFIPVVHDVFTNDNPVTLNRSLAMTSVFLFLQTIVFGILWLL
ncbi:MAG: 1,4-dihydroxy-2-naphthoate octaprenyltransferase [Candidatus Omnitrophota bacterium]